MFRKIFVFGFDLRNMFINGIGVLEIINDFFCLVLYWI